MTTNYTIGQGQSLMVPITIQLNGQPILATASTGLNSNQVVVSDPGNMLVSQMRVGNSITGSGIQPNTIIKGIAGTTLTINQPAASTAASASIVVGAQVALDITNYTFLFTAKTSKTLADTDPTVILATWTETTTPLLGQTRLVLTNNQTGGPLGPPVQINTPYFYQVWFKDPTVTNLLGFPAISPLLEGIITFTQSVSSRAN